jgi:Pyruvate/2-oxoacid:ferredoxin oxidoreductase gamma subunit
MRIFNTVICGVGGTGVIGFGMLLKKLGMPHGYTVLGSETRGSSQRGGAVTSSVRYIINGDGNTAALYKGYYPPSIPVGKADIMIATESSEVLRQVIYLNEGTKVLINRFCVVPKPDRSSIKHVGGGNYPDNDKIFEDITKITRFVRFVDASETSLKLFGTPAMTNYILLGAALQTTDLPIENDLLMNFLPGRREKEAVLKGKELANR